MSKPDHNDDNLDDDLANDDNEGHEELDEESDCDPDGSLGLLTDYLAGEMSAEERLAFAKRREEDWELDWFAAIMERVWASPERGEINPVREILGAVDGLDAREGETEAETEARRAFVREKNRERAAFLEEASQLAEAERRRAAPRIPNANPITHPWIMSVLAIAYPLILGSG
jgi:hypothetical protein